jgi:hypothetical protein
MPCAGKPTHLFRNRHPGIRTPGQPVPHEHKHLVTRAQASGRIKLGDPHNTFPNSFCSGRACSSMLADSSNASLKWSGAASPKGCATSCASSAQASRQYEQWGLEGLAVQGLALTFARQWPPVIAPLLLTPLVRTALQYRKGWLAQVGLGLPGLAWRRSRQAPGGQAPLGASPPCSYYRASMYGSPEQAASELTMDICCFNCLLNKHRGT